MSTSQTNAYRIAALKPNLVLIQWFRTPDDQSADVLNWLEELREIVHNATEPIYFLSDLRHGRVKDIAALFELGILSKHPNWAMGVSFSESISSEVYAGLFSRLSPREKPLADSLAAALTLLEEAKPGLTADVDWREAVTF